MRIAIMGSGGIGGFLGAKLCAAGHDVIFIARGAHLAALKKSGLSLLSQAGNQHLYPVEAYEKTEGITPVDLIFFCVKLYDTQEAARACLPLLQDNTFLLTLQNGVESVEALSAIIGQNKTVGGAIYVSANIQEPGVITHSGGHDTLYFSEKDNQPSPRTVILEHILNGAGLIGIRSDNLQEMLWSKFTLLCANASLGSLMDSGAVTIFSEKDSQDLFVAALWEVYHVAAAMSIMLPENTVPDIQNSILSMGKGNDMLASQCLDLRAGRKLELEWIQGTLRRLGQKYGVPTPINNTAYLALKRFANGSRS